VFQVNGNDLGAPGRVDIYGFGGAGGAIIWPWVTQGTRTVLVSETPGGYGPWIVVDPLGVEDTAVVDAAGDTQGNVYLVYTKSRGGMASEGSHHFVRLSAELLQGSSGTVSANADMRTSTNRIKAVTGQMIAKHPGERDPAPGGLGFYSRPADYYRSLDTGEPLHALTVGEARDPWWGKGFPVRYQMFSGNAWSGAIDVGLADVRSFWGFIWDALDIARIGQDGAFLVWPVEQAIVGRRVERVP
jgi:hypothetical protein